MCVNNFKQLVHSITTHNNYILNEFGQLGKIYAPLFLVLCIATTILYTRTRTRKSEEIEHQDKLSRQWEINHTCINIDFESSDRTSIILDGFDKFNFCACGINTKGHYLVNQSSVHADSLYIFCTPVRSQSQDFIQLGEKKHQLSKSVFNGYVSEVYKGERDSLWVFPKYIGLGPPASGSSALQEYIMSNKYYYKFCTRGYHRCVNTKKEVKFWNRGRNLERSKDGRKYCYAPNLDCYLLRTPTKKFAEKNFYGEITVTLLWHLKSPEYIQQLSPENTKLIFILRDPVSINWLSYIPLSRFIFVPASKLRCNTEEVMRGVFESIGVSQEFDRSKINYEINVNTNRIGKTSKGYGNIEKTTSDSMGAGFHRASKSSVCVPQKNLKHINEKLRARLEDFFEGYTVRLGNLLGIPVDELY
ncbi:unnamed protein product [Bathycoccus prasinos]